ncbi:MAG: prephenate dehydratase [Nitrospinota bacterium]|nr:prephenate dehydratase [Nitrospinota bacterium]
MTDKKIEELRKEIDKIDSETLVLLNKRADLAIQIGKIKKATNSHVHFPARERELIERLSSQNKGPLNEEMIGAIYREVISAVRSLENDLKISYLGPPGTFTHMAAISEFGSSSTFVPAGSIDDILADTERGRAEYGVVPVENSTEGMVTRTLDLLVDTDLKIYGERFMPIHLYLLSKSNNLKEIKKVYSHYQPLAQAIGWLNTNMKGIPLEETPSTIYAAEKASTEVGAAAISSKYAASIHGLNILGEKIEDVSGNTTRFLILGNREREVTGNDKTSLILSTKNEPGALHRILELFAKESIDLTKIESRPMKKKVWEYLFFIDLKGHKDDPLIKKVLDRLAKEVTFLKISGSYPVSR